MKRTLSILLALTIALGSVPVQAQTVRVSMQTGTAPVPVPSGLVSPMGIAALPFNSVSLTPSLVPAMSGMPSPSVAVIAVPAAIAAAAPAPAPATPLAALKAISAPEALAVSGLTFDGSLHRSAASVAEPPRSPEPAPRKNLLQRYRDSRGKNPLQNSFGKSMFLTASAAAAVPVLWDAVPAMKYLYALAAADLLMLAVILPVAVGAAVWRKLSRAPQTASKPPPSRRAKAVVIGLGMMLGLGAAIAPYQAVGPAVELVRSVVDSQGPAAERDSVRHIAGGAVQDEAEKMLSVNPIGREILRKLTDRGGTLRLPPFFISNQEDSYGQHESFYDGVYLNANEVTRRGWTVEQFLKDPALQRQLIREMSATVVHELTHAVQGRRPPWTKGYFSNSTEAEQEAFFKEMLFRVAELERDPAARNDGHDAWMVTSAADDLDGFLKSVAEMYEKNAVVGEPYFNAFLKEQRARWPVYRVHIYQVLAARADSPGMAKMYLDKAKAAAKEAGLPEPTALVASR